MIAARTIAARRPPPPPRASAVRALLLGALLAGGPSLRAQEQEAGAARAALPADLPIDLQADLLTYGSEPGVLLLEGHVVAERAGARLRAARGRLDRARGILVLEGGVVAAQGNQIALADRATIDLAGHAADLAGAVLYVKEGSPALGGITDAQAARALGKNALTARATRVEQGAGGALTLHDVVATPCDCASQPDYLLLAGTALVQDDRAQLRDVHLQLLGVTVPLFPVTLPLLDRQSGLLAPQLSSNAAGGFRLAQPVFLALNRSWDLTLTPALHFGGGTAGSPRAMQGPRLGAELRWFPQQWNRGALSLDLLQDLKAGTSPVSAALFPGERPTGAGRGFGGLRGALALEERVTLGGWSAAAEGTLYSDALFVADTTRLPPGYLDLARVDLGLLHADGPVSAGLSATALQDLRPHPGGSGDRRLFGPEARATPQRLPSPFVQLAPVLLGPFVLGGEAGAAAFGAAVSSAQERATGFAPTDLGASGATADPAGRDLSRAGLVRFDLAPRLTLALSGDAPLRGRVLLGGRADGWLFPARTGLDARRLQGFADADVSVLLARRFGDLLHTIEPRAQVRVLSPALLGGVAPGDPADAGGSGPLVDAASSQQGAPVGVVLDTGAAALGVPAVRRAYDEIDGAGPSTGGAATALSVRQALWTKPAGQSLRRLLWLQLQQDLVLWNGAGSARLADSSVALGLDLGRLTLGGEVRADASARLVTYATANAGWSDGRQDSLRVSLTALRAAATDRIRAGLDELLATTHLALAPGDFGGAVTASATWALPTEARGLFASADLVAFLNQQPAGYPNVRLAPAFNWRPPCGCASLGLRLDFPYLDGSFVHRPDVNFVFDLKSLGR